MTPAFINLPIEAPIDGLAGNISLGRSPGYPAEINLADARLVAQGHIRLIYAHDEFPRALIKVIKPRRMSPGGELVYKRKPWRVKLPRRLGAYMSVYREVGEFLAFQARYRGRPADRPIAGVYGFVETGQGLGILAEKLTGPDGELAPTLSSMIENGAFQHEHRVLLGRFFQTVKDCHVCLHDLHLKNIVFVGTLEFDGHFVAVDGLGARTLIPLMDWFRWINTRHINKIEKTVWAAIDRKVAAARRH